MLKIQYFRWTALRGGKTANSLTQRRAQTSTASNLRNKTKPRERVSKRITPEASKLTMRCVVTPALLCFSSRKAVGALRLLTPRSLMVWWSSELRYAPQRPATPPTRHAHLRSTCDGRVSSVSEAVTRPVCWPGGGTRRNTGVRYWFKWKEFGQLISAVSPVWQLIGVSPPAFV